MYHSPHCRVHSWSEGGGDRANWDMRHKSTGLLILPPGFPSQHVVNIRCFLLLDYCHLLQLHLHHIWEPVLLSDPLFLSRHRHDVRMLVTHPFMEVEPTFRARASVDEHSSLKLVVVTEQRRDVEIHVLGAELLVQTYVWTVLKAQPRLMAHVDIGACKRVLKAQCRGVERDDDSVVNRRMV